MSWVYEINEYCRVSNGHKAKQRTPSQIGISPDGKYAVICKAFHGGFLFPAEHCKYEPSGNGEIRLVLNTKVKGTGSGIHNPTLG
jgi:hypothetical protein